MSRMGARIAIAGVGNCASVFLQGLRYYSSGSKAGLWHPKVAGLSPKDLEVVAAFDIDDSKVGLTLDKAAFVRPNVAKRYVALSRSRIHVSPGIAGNDLPPHLKGEKISRTNSSDVTRILEEEKVDILLNLISSGSDDSSEEYAKAALRAGCAFVNCTPTLLLKRNKLVAEFQEARLPLVGDDLMSQFGGTVFHRGLLSLMVRRGVTIGKSYQLDVGGGTETLNTIDESIKLAKRDVKTSAVAAEVPYQFQTIAGTTDFVDYMGNDRTSYFWFEGAGFMNSGITVDVYLRSTDGANGGNVLLDVLRATFRVMQTRKLGSVGEICAYGFKSPPRRAHFEEAYSKFAALFVR